MRIKLKRSIVRLILILVATAFFPGHAPGQMLPERVQAEAEQATIDEITIDDTLLNRNNVAICNDSDQDITILLGEMFSPPDTFEIESNSIWYSKTYNKGELFVSIQTGKNIIKYTLLQGKAYLLCWNDEKKYWYLRKLYRD
jgi:hypothetical protein